MAENRVTQIAIEASYSAIPNALVTQIVIETSSRVGVLGVFQDTTHVNVSTFPAGGDVTKVPIGIPVVQNTTYVNQNTFPAGGSVDNNIALVGTATIPSTAAVETNGVVAWGLPLYGTATIPTGAAVNGGGAAEIGLYTITLPMSSILGFMDLGTIQLAQVVSFGLSPIAIEGAFTYVPASTALVYSPGVVSDGETLAGSATIPSSASAGGGGSLAGLGLVGSATAPSSATVPTPGQVQLLGSLALLGSFTVPTGSAVPTPGNVILSSHISGTATVASTATVYGGGVLGGGAVMTGQPNTGMWAGYGQSAMPVRIGNLSDLELLKDRLAMRRMMRGVEKANVAAGGGLSGLGESSGRRSFRDYCAPAPYVNCHKVNLRKNLFERGKLLTPADGGAANHTVLEFYVPTGYDCSLLAYYTVYTGTGFVQGSGDIIWRIRVGNAWARNAGNLLFALGNAAGTVTLGTAIELVGDDRVQFQVNVPNTSGLIQVGASYILCGVQGWLYPTGSWAQLEGR